MKKQTRWKVLAGFLGLFFAIVLLMTWAIPAREKTTLIRAIQQGDSVVVSKLVKKRPSLLETDLMSERRTNISPLAAAVALGNEQVCRVLIEAGANLNAQDKTGETPLHTAVRKGHIRIVTLLISSGASTTIKDKRGQSALDLARESSHPALIEALGNSNLQ